MTSSHLFMKLMTTGLKEFWKENEALSRRTLLRWAIFLFGTSSRLTINDNTKLTHLKPVHPSFRNQPIDWAGFYIIGTLVNEFICEIYAKSTIKITRTFTLAGLILATYYVRYPQAVPFLRNKMPYFLLKTSKTCFLRGCSVLNALNLKK